MDKQISNINDLKDLLDECMKTHGNLPILIRDINCELHKNVNLHVATAGGKPVCVLDI